MKNKKNVVPEKLEGKISVAGKKLDVGSVKSVAYVSSKDMEEAVKELSRKKIFAPPSYVMNN